MIFIINYDILKNKDGSTNVFYLLKKHKSREPFGEKYNLEDIYKENKNEVLNDLECLYIHYRISTDLHEHKNKVIDKLKDKIYSLEAEIEKLKNN